jgi:hypothetical protein
MIAKYDPAHFPGKKNIEIDGYDVSEKWNKDTAMPVYLGDVWQPGSSPPDFVGTVLVIDQSFPGDLMLALLLCVYPLLMAHSCACAMLFGARNLRKARHGGLCLGGRRTRVPAWGAVFHARRDRVPVHRHPDGDAGQVSLRDHLVVLRAAVPRADQHQRPRPVRWP